MKILDIKCPACGASADAGFNGGVYTCEYCGTRFISEVEGSANNSAQGKKENRGQSDNENSGKNAELRNIPMEQYLSDQCAELLQKVNQSDFEITEKCKRGLNVPASDTVYLMHDDTMFKSGKNGFAFTDKGIYCRELMEGSNFTSWKDFSKLETPKAVDNSYIRCGSKSICYFTGDNYVLNHNLLQMVERLHKRARLGNL